MKTCRQSTLMLLVSLIFLINSGSILSQQPNQKVKIGVYDSRALAIAYANSEIFKAELVKKTAEYKKANEENKTEYAKELDAEGKVQQQLLHEQTFSNGSVSNIIEIIKDKVQKVAQDAGVSIIISKWEIVYQDKSLDYKDVTDKLVKIFNPTEQALKWIEEIKKQNPMPIDKFLLTPN